MIRRERRSRRTLERKLHELNSQLKKSFEHFEEERARLETTFSGMVEGVLLTNERGDILHLNPAFREMFGLRGNVEGRSALEVLASVAADDAIQKVIRTEKPVECEIAFEKPKNRVFQIHFSPMKRQGKLFGVVSVFHDLTKIRRLEEVRRDFIANLSHEIKTPLTAIRGFSETLLEEWRNKSAGRGDSPSRPYNPEIEKHLEIIFRHAAQLSQLTENLMNLSHIESGKEEILSESIPLKPFVDQLFERFLMQAEVKQIGLHNEISESAEPIQADPNKLNQILSNLIDNAIKFTPQKGKIWVRGEMTNRTYCIEVGDTGIGIPHEEQARIFERFYRVDEARTRESSGVVSLGNGAGLGLAIVKHLVELHGGRVVVESVPGEGSRFSIFLPQP